MTAKGAMQWMRALARTATKRPEASPFVELTSGRDISIRLSDPLPYELDGGDRKATDRIRVRVESEAAVVCVPDEEANR